MMKESLFKKGSLARTPKSVKTFLQKSWQRTLKKLHYIKVVWVTFSKLLRAVNSRLIRLQLNSGRALWAQAVRSPFKNSIRTAGKFNKKQVLSRISWLGQLFQIWMNNLKTWKLRWISQKKRLFVPKTQRSIRRKWDVTMSGGPKFQNCKLSTKILEINLKLKKQKTTSTWMLLRFSLHNLNLQRTRSLSLKNKFWMLTTFSNGVQDQTGKISELRLWKLLRGFTLVKSPARLQSPTVKELSSMMNLVRSYFSISKTGGFQGNHTIYR